MGNSLRWPRATVLIALVQTICFAAQYLVVEVLGKPYDIYLGLSAYGMRNAHLWEIVTSLFLHAGPVHFLVNLVGILVLGSAVEFHLGPRLAWRAYFGAGLAGNLVQAVASLLAALVPAGSLLSERFGGPLVASSTGLFAWLALLCFLPAGAAGQHASWARIRGRPRLRVAVLGAVSLWSACALVTAALPQVAHLAHLTGLWWGLRRAKRSLA